MPKFVQVCLSSIFKLKIQKNTDGQGFCERTQLEKHRPLRRSRNEELTWICAIRISHLFQCHCLIFLPQPVFGKLSKNEHRDLAIVGQGAVFVPVVGSMLNVRCFLFPEVFAQGMITVYYISRFVRCLIQSAISFSADGEIVSSISPYSAGRPVLQV